MQTEPVRPYPQLFSSVRAGNHILKSRLLYPNASPHFLQGPETYPADGFRAYFASVARNGAAVITIAEWDNARQHDGPWQLDIAHMQSFRPSHPAVQNYMSLLAEDVHFSGSKLLVSAMIDWPEGYSLYGGPRQGPGGARPDAPIDAPIPAAMLPQVVEGFLDKMRMYRSFGYDGVTMRVDREIVPQPDSRDDDYASTTMASRSRFVRELYAAVKREFGGDFLTEAQIAWQQPTGYGHRTTAGVSADEVAEYCRLADRDLDILQIREQDATRSHPTGYNFTFGDHPAVGFARRLKREGITALLAPIGGFQEPDEMEGYLEEGACDMFGVARAFIADSEYGEKMKQGRALDIIPCLKCNVCHGKVVPDPEPWVSVCSVNPTFGLEHELPKLLRPSTAKSVAVVGGGAAGMRAAIEAAQRGHTVTLYEKTDVLGGQLAHADAFEFKWPLKNYREWLVRQLDQNGVEVVMGCAPDPEQLRARGFDAVIAATGAEPMAPTGIDGVFDAEGRRRYPIVDEMWGREPELGRRVAIVGGSEAGAEMAIHLARHGHEVTLLTRRAEIAHDASKLHYVTMSFVKELPDGSFEESPEWERYDNIDCIVNARTVEVGDHGVTYVDEEGAEHVVPVDDVLVSGGRRRLLEEALAYGEAAAQFYAIGDCVGAGNVQVCTRQAYARAAVI
ncbi:MAG: FAD-dependent oxidoreductase [Microbacterium sp.]|uniref:FAD-dependent oxidoreductase n=1 Tax=Microbacterium sp. TaxID=51671 RepID=UPI0039E35D69